MTRIAVITTTINVPTVLTQWVDAGLSSDDTVWIAGDNRSPHGDITAFIDNLERSREHPGRPEINYLTPSTQESYKVSHALGWNCIQRRNIALLAAMQERPEFILTIDDDNAPTHPQQINMLVNTMEGNGVQVPIVSTNTGWYNPGRHCLTNEIRTVTHRGFPLSQRHVKPFITYEHHIDTPIGVAAMLWTGDPDIDAVERIVSAPNVARIDGGVVLRPDTWAPFNTQATMFRGELAPAMFMFPGVGRYDDIWASYVTRRVMDQLKWGAYYGRPAVHQARNEHDLVRDLEDELFGMRHNETIIAALRDVEFMDDDTIAAMAYRCVSAMANTGVPFADSMYAADKWFEDVAEVLGE